MIPKSEIVTTQQTEYPTRTYRIDWGKGVVSGRCDGLPAMEQAVHKILDTQRFRELIYSWRYGAELSDLIGKPVSFVYPELERRITEALMQDDRILSVGAFQFERRGRAVAASFVVTTTQGEWREERQINV